MARDVHQQWDDDDDERYSEEDADDTPILSYRYDKQKRCTYTRDGRPERERRWAVTLVAKCSLFSTAMILFCVLMYIPVYNRANEQLPKVAVAGWSIHTNRDTRIYVQPENVTAIHEPKDVCSRSDRSKKNKLFLLIVVCSATDNFEQRTAIRETWGSYDHYLRSGKIFNVTRDKYKHYNYSYDLYDESHRNLSVARYRRDISGIGGLLPELARALSNNLDKDEQPEQRFDEKDDKDDMLSEFDMNKELGDEAEEAATDFDYDYESNIMKIPPKGYEDNPNLDSVLNLLRNAKDFPKKELLEEEAISDDNVDFKLVFLLGQPTQDNDTDVQGKIEEEVEKYGDVIQEGFLDSYNNLTLKSIMMLKWVTNNCDHSVRYILKTDDDMYINIPQLVVNLRNRSRVHDETKPGKKEYLLIGDLICGAKPVQDANNKWYSPRYMYNGRVYPHYLSGTGYVMSADTAHALYDAALRTHYFHLEDIYITGLCAGRASPRITPRDEPAFSYSVSSDECAPHAHISTHRVAPPRMREIQRRLLTDKFVDRCERIRLTQIKQGQSRMFIVYKYLRLLISNQC
ncbi:uncharacterized protein LOC121738203 [Aricia agestis]|uniref:uncharacterized protein LOC121738203 n=1 Tax=Aricia agestis TaxID=91739 RepID=UPI001C20A41D|nr:uncharacterized protein LOC121738203 [Aricia agestis]XP_041986072.1 uncharacterized protein LOC121738203 [Aricia agestis]